MAQTITEQTELMDKIQDLLKSNGKEEFVVCIIHKEETGGNTAETMIGKGTTCRSLSHVLQLVEDVLLAKSLIDALEDTINEMEKDKPTA